MQGLGYLFLKRNEEKMLSIAYNSQITINFPHYFEEDVGWYKVAEKNTKQFFISNIKPNFTIIDAGAQIGMYSVLFSKLAYNGKIHCFEPTDTINLLNKNLEFNDCKNVETHQIALSDKDGEYEDVIYKQWSQNKIDQKKFKFSTLDTFIRRNNLLVDLIKIDVDSYDYEVLLGSKEVLSNQSPIVIVELNHALKKRGFKPEDGIEFMNSINYKIDKILDNENFIFTKK